MSMSTARRFGSRARNFPLHFPQGILLQLGLRQQPLELAVLSRSSRSSLAALTSIPPCERRQLYSLAAETSSSAAICSPVLPSAASSSARRSLAHDLLRRMHLPLTSSHQFQCPSSPILGPSDSKTKRRHARGTRRSRTSPPNPVSPTRVLKSPGQGKEMFPPSELEDLRRCRRT